MQRCAEYKEYIPTPYFALSNEEKRSYKHGSQRMFFFLNIPVGIVITVRWIIVKSKEQT